MFSTVARVRAIASNLEHLPDSTIQMHMDDAQTEMEFLSYHSKFEEVIHRYLSAHKGSIDNPKPSAEEVDGLGKVSYGERTQRFNKEGLQSTEYGQEVSRLLNLSSELLAKEKGVNLLVIS